ncbi:MAG: hypothetical protein KGP12_11170 [Actinomycetales bacterium]|nr:hypothetical protein [Actinomycetales bacterium]
MTLGMVLARGSRMSTTGDRRTASPTAGIRRGLVAMALTWQGLTVGLDPQLRPGAQPVLALQVVVALVPLTWLGVLACFWLPSTSARVEQAACAANAVALLAAGLAIDALAGAEALRSGSLMPGASLVSVAGGVGGMLLAAAAARVLIAVAAVAQVLIIAMIGAAGPWPGLVADLCLYPLYLVAIGAAAVGARRALLHAASEHEDALAAAELARARSTALSQVRRMLAGQERRIHETVLNTLSAIAGGGLGANPGSVGRIRAAARESAAVLRSIDDASVAGTWPLARQWRTDLLGAIDRLAIGGITVDLVVRTRAVIPDIVYEAVLAATREALANADRHAGARSVTVTVSESVDDHGCQAVDVVIDDDGSGFDVDATPRRFGIEQSIVRAMRDVGGDARIESTPRRGTVVSLRVPIGPDRPPEPQVPAVGATPAGAQAGTIPRSSAAFARPVLGWFGVYVLVAALLTWQQLGWSPDAVGSLTLVTALAVVLWILSARAMLSGWFVLATAIVAPAAYALQQPSITGASLHWADWTSQAIAVIWLVVTAIGPWWSIWLALASWLVTQGDPLHELTQPGTAVIVAGAIFARSVRRHSRLMGRALQERAAEQAQAMAEEDGLRRMRMRHELLEESGARRTLEGICEGILDPLAEPVRASCGVEERFIRAVMRLDPGADLVHERAGRLVVQGRHRGIIIDLDLSDTAGWPASACDRFFEQVEQVIGLADPSEPARLSARREGQALVLRLVAGDGIDVIEARHA